MKHFMLIVVILAFATSQAKAMETNPEGAEKLRASFQDMLDYQQTVNKAFGSIKIEYQGNLHVEPSDGFYAITFPYIKISSVEPTEEKAKEKFTNPVFDIGVIKVNAVATEKSGYWQTTWALPSEMKMSDDSGEDFIISFKDQNIVAVLNEKLGYFTKINSILSSISFIDGGKDTGLSIGSIKALTNLDEGSNNKYAGPFQVAINDITIAPPESGDITTLDSFSFEGNVADMTLPSLSEYKQKIMQHSDVFESLGTIEKEEDIEGLDQQKITDMLFDLYDFDMSSFNFHYGIKGLNVKSAPSKTKTVLENFSLGSADFGFGFENLNSESGTMSIAIGYKEMNSESEDSEYSDFIPKTLRFDMKAQKIPYATLTQVAQNSMKSVIQTPETAQMVGVGLMMKIPAVLSQAGTEIIFNNNGFGNDIYDFYSEGKMSADLTAAMGFTAQFVTVFDGLDTVISMMKENPEHEDTLKTLTKMKEIGALQDDGSHGNAYKYDLQAHADGSITINGKSTKELFPEEEVITE